MRKQKKRTVVLVAAVACAVLAGLGVQTAVAQPNGSGTPGLVNKGPINPKTWKYGHRFDPPSGCTLLECPAAQTWNPVKKKLMQGEDVFGGTVLTTDPDSYCALANSGSFDFTWTEVQHAPATWESVSNEYAACPGGAVPGGQGAVPGARVAAIPDARYTVQHAADEGAMVIVVPQVDTVEQAKDAVDWTYFPPIGMRSSGGGPAFSLYKNVPGGYRNTYNQNVVLIVMIESVEGAMNAAKIAKIPGVDGLFAASSDLGSFSGYTEGDPDYEKLVTAVHDAAVGAGKWLCGPSSWGPGAHGENRPDFNCFQGGEQN